MANQGFFNLGQLSDPTRAVKKTASRMKSCPHCVSTGIQCDTVFGEGKKKIAFVIEKSTSQDKPFTVEQEKLMWRMCVELGYALYIDFIVIPTVPCVHDKIDKDYIDSQRSRLFKTLDDHGISVVIPLGMNATYAMLHHKIEGRLKGTKTTQFYGECIPDHQLQKFICPTYAPDYLLTRRGFGDHKAEIDPVYTLQFKNTVLKALSVANTELIQHEPNVQIVKKCDEAKNILKSIIESKPSVLAFDYETNGIKPHRKEMRLKTVAFASDLGCQAFPFFYDDAEFLELYRLVMQDPKIKKVAHKIDMEDGWTIAQLGYPIIGWHWDTCIGAHCLHSSKPVGQKFLVAVNFGLFGYDSDSDKYISTPLSNESINGELVKSRTNTINQIDFANIDDILLYNGFDSYYCLELYKLQFQQADNFQKKGILFFTESMVQLSHIQQNGMCIDTTVLESNNKKLEKLIAYKMQKIEALPEYSRWQEKQKLNINSETQLKKFLYDILGYPKPADGTSFTDEKQLKALGTELTLLIIEYRKFSKLHGTYLGQFRKEEVNSKIHAFFNLHIASTFRSSSDSPNFQNLPNGANAEKFVLNCIVPRPGNILVENDFKGAEVTVGCAYHNDTNMKNYLLDPTTDMHRDTAADMMLLSPTEVDAYQRQMLGKSGVVFPAFYGAGASSIAPNTWERLRPADRDHLVRHKIASYEDWQNHISAIVKKFWEVRFPQYNEWKQKVWQDYQKCGYVELKTGFRCAGPLTYTQAINAPIQGSAFHCLLWVLSQINPIVEKRMPGSYIIGQIHDALVADIRPEHEAEYDALIREYSTQRIPEKFPWIDLPMKFEKLSTKVNGSWASFEEKGFI